MATRIKYNCAISPCDDLLNYSRPGLSHMILFFSINSGWILFEDHGSPEKLFLSYRFRVLVVSNLSISRIPLEESYFVIPPTTLNSSNFGKLESFFWNEKRIALVSLTWVSFELAFINNRFLLGILFSHQYWSKITIWR